MDLKVSIRTNPVNLNSANKAGSNEVKEQTTPQISKEDNGAGSKAISNYFKASQLVVFKGHACAKSDFKVKRQEGIPCACCGRPMMTDKGVKNFEAEAVGAKGAELRELLSANMEYFRGTEKSMVNFFMKASEKNEEGTLSELLAKNAPNALTILVEEEKNVLSRMSKQAKESFGEDNAMERCIQRGLKKIDANRPGNPFTRKAFLKDVLETSKVLGNKEEAAKLLDIAVQLPSSQNTISAFIVKYSDRDDKAIAHRLAQPAIATAEHIHPDSLGGPDHTSNYMGECADCNSHRGNMPLEEWMQEYPNMPRSVQRNIDEVTERIINGDLGGRYDDYPIDLKETIERESNNIIKLTVKNPEEIDKIRKERGIEKPTAENEKTKGGKHRNINPETILREPIRK